MNSANVVSLKYNGLVLYMITCKYNGNDVKKTEREILDTVRGLDIQLVDYRFEGDGSNMTNEKLHLHGIFYGPQYLRFKDYQIKGWNMYIKKCYSTNGQSYCLKSDTDVYKIRKQMALWDQLSLKVNLFDYYSPTVRMEPLA